MSEVTTGKRRVKGGIAGQDANVIKLPKLAGTPEDAQARH